MYVSEDQRMVEAQARIISKLRDDYEKLQALSIRLVAENDRNRQAAEFYFELQTAILNNPTLQSEWMRFCTFLKMADPSLDKPTPLAPDEVGDGWIIPYIP